MCAGDSPPPPPLAVSSCSVPYPRCAGRVAGLLVLAFPGSALANLAGLLPLVSQSYAESNFLLCVGFLFCMRF